jgi:SAM-dependent methyltransferase
MHRSDEMAVRARPGGKRMTQWEGTHRPTDKPAFGATATSYALYRHGFPTSMYDTWQREGILKTAPMAIADLGTGTGTLARAVARAGHNVTAIDTDEAMLAQARTLAAGEKLTITFLRAGAEHTGLADNSQDMVTAGQCWHWFNRPTAAREANRLLKPGGTAMICHYDWLPLPGNIVAITEELILAFNPDWRAAGGTGIYPHWHTDLAIGGFRDIRSFSYDEPARYRLEGWVGRIEASAGIAVLPQEKREQFKSILAERISRDYGGDTIDVPHRVFCVWGSKDNR